MGFFCGKNRGAISVFLTLILVPVLIFSGIIVDASRLYASKTVISGAGDLTMNAALSRYDKELKDSYGLIAMAESPDSQQMKDSLEKYFKESCNAFYLEGEETGSLHSMIQLELGDGGIQAKGVETSSLANTQVLQQQILEYMKFRGPVYMVTDILEKFQKIPLKNMNEKEDYVKAKTNYGKEASKLGDSLENAKEYVEQHGNALEYLNTSVEGGITSLIEGFREQSAFWLAARSLENYLDYITIAPIGNGTISIETVRKNLAGSIVWSEAQTAFSDAVYADLIAAVSLYQVKDSLLPQLMETNQFTPEEIESYRNIEITIQQSISNMDKIYDSAAKSYKESIETLEQEADHIIEAGNKGIDQLEKLIDIWENNVQKAKDDCREKAQVLKDLGEDINVIEEAWENEEISINVEDARHLILILDNNVQEAQNARKQLENLKAIPDSLRNEHVSGEEGKILLDLGYKEGVRQYWTDHQIGSNISVSVSFQNVFQEKFYQETLQSIGEGNETEEARQKKDENEREADNSQNRYVEILNAIETGSKEKNLENYKEISYPSEFPSGLEKVLPDITSSKKIDKIDVSGDDVSDVTNASQSMDSIGQFLEGLDNIAGQLLESAYLMEYMTEMFNCLTTKEGETSLAGGSLDGHYIYNGEMEYILYGNPSTVVNKMNAIGILFALRLSINSVYVFFDKQINMEGDRIAAGVCTATGQAWLYPIVKYGYMLCRAIIMSVQDLIKLSGGKDVPVWPGNEKITLCYKEYMKLFLLIALMDNDGEKKLVSRAADCIQLNTGKELSGKYTMLTLEAQVESTTAFLPRVPVFLGTSDKEDEGKKVIQYKGILAY